MPDTPAFLEVDPFDPMERQRREEEPKILLDDANIERFLEKFPFARSLDRDIKLKMTNAYYIREGLDESIKDWRERNLGNTTYLESWTKSMTQAINAELGALKDMTVPDDVKAEFDAFLAVEMEGFERDKSAIDQAIAHQRKKISERLA